MKPPEAVVPPPEPAGSIPPVVSIQVTGDRTPPWYWMPFIEEKIRAGIVMKTAGNIKVDTAKAFILNRRLTPGKTAVALIPVTIWAPKYSQVKKTVIAFAENTAVLGFGRPDKIFISNSPESVKHGGELLSDELPHASSARFMIHHRNASGKSLKLVFYLRNTGKEPAAARLIGYNTFALSKDEMAAGHKATINFLKTAGSGLGRIVEIPAGRTFAIKRITLDPGQTASGLLEIQMIRGDGVFFHVRALDRYVPDQADFDQIGDYSSRRAHGVFASPYIAMSEDYTVGGKWKFITVGDSPLNSKRSGDSILTGNYGVTYLITVNANNPHTTEEQVFLDFQAGGGPALASLLVNERLHDVKLTRPSRDSQITSFNLKPGETRRLTLEIIPEAGSNYPVRLILRSRRIK